MEEERVFKMFYTSEMSVGGHHYVKHNVWKVLIQMRTGRIVDLEVSLN